MKRIITKVDTKTSSKSVYIQGKEGSPNKETNKEIIKEIKETKDTRLIEEYIKESNEVKKHKSNNSSLASFNSSNHNPKHIELTSKISISNDEVINGSYNAHNTVHKSEHLITELNEQPLLRNKTEKFEIDNKKLRILQSHINSMKNINTLASNASGTSPGLAHLTKKLKNKFPVKTSKSKGKINSLHVSSTSREKIVYPSQLYQTKVNIRATNANSLLSASSLYMQKQNQLSNIVRNSIEKEFNGNSKKRKHHESSNNGNTLSNTNGIMKVEKDLKIIIDNEYTKSKKGNPKTGLSIVNPLNSFNPFTQIVKEDIENISNSNTNNNSPRDARMRISVINSSEIDNRYSTKEEILINSNDHGNDDESNNVHLI